jgi:hypothetical protein
MAQTGGADPSLRSVETQLAQVREEYERLSEAIRTAKGRQRVLAAEMRALEAHLLLARDPEGGTAAAMQAGTLGAATAAILRSSGPMRIADLVRELQDRGKLLRSEWAYSTLAKTLARDPRFKRVQSRRGYWQVVARTGRPVTTSSRRSG